MINRVDWDRTIGRRFRLRDLHVFFTVAQLGSMGKAGAHLGISQPSVSEVIADLEHALRVKLFDRSRTGVELTAYGHALLTRGRAAFDELRQGINDIEHLADPAAGDIRIGCAESIAAGFLPPVIELLSTRYPRTSVHVGQLNTPTLEFPELDDRKVDLVLARLARPDVSKDLSDKYQAEIVFDDRLCVVVGEGSRWARRRKVEIGELADEQWILLPFETPGASWVLDALRKSGRELSKKPMTTYSVHLRNHLLSTGRFVSVHPTSVVRQNAKRFGFKALPIELPMPRWPVAAVTLKGRTANPVTPRFIECAREIANQLGKN
jgi:DNA-binding transcriptional LysR family regulator